MIGYQAANCTPPKIEPRAAAVLPSAMIRPSVLVIGSTAEGIALLQVGGGPFGAGLDRVEVHVDGLLLALEVEVQRGLDLVEVDADHLRQDADVDHVADQVAEVRGHVGIVADQLLDRHGVDRDVGAGDLAA